ncbi:actin-like ATPase domain-containing protein [Phanerochaete sordida]|uniref:Actin-like ATPase domain-containing protein n=1 Tax=Phanerochaete sordida TaxID=48140 RepID=A0A9P3LD06_9APHY|nr:actin-like ATPase domain-containing protein [Phanerochaete sordida]
MAATKANGSADAPIEVSSAPAVIGINFGNSYASIAVLNKEENADCIANEDGERQIACAIAFHGEEMYIGNQAKHQLVKNSQNTIIGFRNLLGKKFSEIPADKPTNSAPVIQHPDLPDTAAYKVQVLQPAPTPLPTSKVTSAAATPSASNVATPRSEPTPTTRILTVSEVTTIFLKSLVQSAEDFLGRKVHGVVITIPTWFGDEQKKALEEAAKDAGVAVLQLLEEAGAAVVATTSAPRSDKDTLGEDRTQLVVDLGASGLELSLLSVRQGLAYSLATLSDHTVGGDAIDDRLIKFFAKEFTKKTKTPLTVAPATEPQDKRAEAKLRLAVEHTKRTLSASTGAATCSVESLKDGLDFTGAINRLRFDMEMRPIYDHVYKQVQVLASSAGLDLYDIDEVVYVGGSASLPGLDEALAAGLSEDVVTPFTAGTVVGGGVGDPTTLLARGAVLQAKLLATLGEGSAEEREVKAAFAPGHALQSVKATTRTLGLLFPEEGAENALGGQWVPVVLRETALPARRAVRLDVEVGEGARVGFEVWEAKEGVKITKEAPPKLEGDEDEEDEEEEEIETKEKTLEKEAFLAALTLEAHKARKVDGRLRTTLEVQFLVNEAGGLAITAVEADGGEKVTLAIAPAS